MTVRHFRDLEPMSHHQREQEHGVEYAVIGGIATTKQTSRDSGLPDRKRLRQLRDALRAAQAHRPPDSK